ncbi:MAG: spondin domain-containing protein [Gemmatimonadetes bacterium]|nr:spondin domain-containing protein [Gemmatimonadota bacterium]
MFRRITPFLVSAAVVACGTDQPTALVPADASANRLTAAEYYDVTITNLTTGQPLSPAVIATHVRRVSLFAMGATASAGIKAIAEDGDPSVSAAMLTGARGVYDVVTTGAPAHRIGGPGSTSVQATIKADREHRLLSLATMLICSNDGFAGVNAVALPSDDQPVTAYAYGYDAGTERNTEASADIVPPCFGIGPVSGPAGGSGRRAESRTIRMHPVFHGEAALVPAQHGWKGPVAMITIQRAGGTS